MRRRGRLGPGVGCILTAAPDRCVPPLSARCPKGNAAWRGVAEAATCHLQPPQTVARDGARKKRGRLKKLPTEQRPVCYAEKEGDGVGDRALASLARQRRKKQASTALGRVGQARRGVTSDPTPRRPQKPRPVAVGRMVPRRGGLASLPKRRKKQADPRASRRLLFFSQAAARRGHGVISVLGRGRAILISP